MGVLSTHYVTPTAVVMTHMGVTLTNNDIEQDSAIIYTLYMTHTTRITDTHAHTLHTHTLYLSLFYLIQCCFIQFNSITIISLYQCPGGMQQVKHDILLQLMITLTQLGLEQHIHSNITTL